MNVVGTDTTSRVEQLEALIRSMVLDASFRNATALEYAHEANRSGKVPEREYWLREAERAAVRLTTAARLLAGE